MNNSTSYFECIYTLKSKLTCSALIDPVLCIHSAYWRFCWGIDMDSLLLLLWAVEKLWRLCILLQVLYHSSGNPHFACREWRVSFLFSWYPFCTFILCFLMSSFSLQIDQSSLNLLTTFNQFIHRIITVIIIWIHSHIMSNALLLCRFIRHNAYIDSLLGKF